jgi:hypothetical protein
MNSMVQEYMEVFAKAKGNNLDKVKYILMKCSNHWEWIGSDSIIADLLDDKHITAEDIHEFLHSAVEMEEGNREFKAAVTAINLCLKKSHKVAKPNESEIDYFCKEIDSTDYPINSYYQDLAEAS